MRHYTQLTLVQRYQIQALLEQQFSVSEIAKRLGRHRSTIYRELARNGASECYDAARAQTQAEQRRVAATKHSKRAAWVEEAIEHGLLMGWSLKQLAARISVEKRPDQRISVPTLYRRVAEQRQEGGQWYKRLPRYGKRRWRQRKRGAGARLIPNRRGIEERPDCVNKRARLGDWEGDTVRGKNAHLVTLVERKSRLTLIGKVGRLTAEEVCSKVIGLLGRATHRHTLTLDNGGEFASHETISQVTDTEIYFADPHASHQRGSNENTNGLIRRLWPKGTDFSTVSEEDLARFTLELNTRPRVVLGGLTPIEVYTGKRVALIP